jgi:hypothetical protein
LGRMIIHNVILVSGMCGSRSFSNHSVQKYSPDCRVIANCPPKSYSSDLVYCTQRDETALIIFRTTVLLMELSSNKWKANTCKSGPTWTEAGTMKSVRRLRRKTNSHSLRSPGRSHIAGRRKVTIQPENHEKSSDIS